MKASQAILKTLLGLIIPPIQPRCLKVKIIADLRLVFWDRKAQFFMTYSTTWWRITITYGGDTGTGDALVINNPQIEIGEPKAFIHDKGVTRLNSCSQ